MRVCLVQDEFAFGKKSMGEACRSCSSTKASQARVVGGLVEMALWKGCLKTNELPLDGIRSCALVYLWAPRRHAVHTLCSAQDVDVLLVHLGILHHGGIIEGNERKELDNEGG